jgi:3-oxoacyl-[acyl-carrier protein] reductase
MKTALITGAARGIGKSIAEHFLQEQYKVILVDLDKTELQKTLKEFQKQFKSQVQGHCADVGTEKGVQELITASKKFTSNIEILVNNAGFGGPFETLDKVTEQTWNQVFNTNVKSLFLLSKILLPRMKKNKWGRIINISSIQGLLGAKCSTTYVATKHAVNGYTKAIAAEWGEFGITCNAICPGYVNTRMGAQDSSYSEHTKKILKRTPSGKIGEPKDIAALAVFLASDNSNYVNGSIMTIDGGITADVGL